MSFRSPAFLWTVAIVAMVALAALWFGKGQDASAAASNAPAAPEAVPVTTVIAKTGSIPRIIAGIGVVTPLQSVTLRPRID
eukprot:gene51599-70271_t